MNERINLNEPKSIGAIRAGTRTAGLTMASDPRTCSLLRTLATSKPGGRFLELGSGTGLSTGWILDGMDSNSRLTTVGNDAKVLAILSNSLGKDQRLTVVCADGDEFIRSLSGQTFDFIFADTWSGKYRLLDEALSLVSPSGMYVIDEMLPQSNWSEGHVEKVANLIFALEQRRDFCITKMAWASGIIIATKR